MSGPVWHDPSTWRFDPERAGRPFFPPTCRYGYSRDELDRLLREDERAAFDAEGVSVDALVYCTGTLYDFASMEYGTDPCGPHGPVFDGMMIGDWLWGRRVGAA